MHDVLVAENIVGIVVAAEIHASEKDVCKDDVFLSLSQDMAAKLINRRHNVTINVFDVVLRNLSFGIVKSGLKKGIVVNDSHKRLGDTKRFRR